MLRKMLTLLFLILIHQVLFAEVVIENYDFNGNKNVQKYNNIPKKAVSTNGSTTEIMLKLGLEKHLVGASYQDNPVLAELEDAYKNLNILSKKYPKKESVLSLNPDFIIGWRSAFAPSVLGDIHNWNKLGVHTYIMQNSGVVSGQDPKHCIQDIRNIGEIFGVSNKAKSITDKMEQDIAKIEELTKSIKNKPGVIILEGEQQMKFSVRGGKSLAGKMVEYAGGRNLIEKTATYSLEDIIKANPGIIIIVHMQTDGQTVEDRISNLKKHSVLSQLNAIKNNKIYAMPLAETYCAGVRVADGIKRMAMFFHPEIINEESFK